jgi:hypothetical protein
METAERQPRDTKRAPAILAGAALAGFLTQGLLWKADLGLGWFLVDVILVATTIIVLRPVRWLAAGVVAAANLTLGFVVVYYASDWALRLAFPANLALLFLLPFVSTAKQVEEVPGSILERILRTPHAIRTTARLPAQVLDSATRDRARSVVRGSLIGLPLALLFSLLLSSDPKFTSLIWGTLSRSGDVSWFGLLSVLTSLGYLVVYILHLPEPTLLPAPRALPYRAEPHEGGLAAKSLGVQLPRVRPLTWGVVIAQVALVFGLFAAVNARELFIGHDVARAVGTGTYAEYLHTGFTRLLCATILAVATVVLGHSLMRHPDRGDPAVRRQLIPGGRPLAALELLLLALVGVALASSWQRSTLYEVAYGYTYLRLAVRFAEFAVLGLLLLTMVKAGARSWLGYPVGVAGVLLGTVMLAACFNADLYVARGNVARAAAVRSGDGSPYAYKTLDLPYLAGLSRDAAPVLRDAYFALEPDPANELQRAWDGKDDAKDWRSFRGLSGRSRR